MPKLSVWLVRASLIHMGIGFLFGAMILHHKGVALFDWTWRLLTLHTELMIFGWVMQLVMGVAFFTLPRFSQKPNRYGAVTLGWVSFFWLNGGAIITAVAQWREMQTYVFIGRLLVLSAVVAYVVMIWPRVKPLMSPAN